MRAIVCPRYGGPDVLELREVEQPSPKDDEVCERRSATLLWRNIRDLLAEGRRKAVLITWYGEGSAVLEPLPADWQWGAES